MDVPCGQWIYDGVNSPLFPQRRDLRSACVRRACGTFRGNGSGRLDLNQPPPAPKAGARNLQARLSDCKPSTADPARSWNVDRSVGVDTASQGLCRKERLLCGHSAISQIVYLDGKGRLFGLRPSTSVPFRCSQRGHKLCKYSHLLDRIVQSCAALAFRYVGSH